MDGELERCIRQRYFNTTTCSTSSACESLVKRQTLTALPAGLMLPESQDYLGLQQRMDAFFSSGHKSA